MKLISWNVNGLRAAVTKGFMESFKRNWMQIFSVYKKQNCNLIKFLWNCPGYEQYWNSAVKKAIVVRLYSHALNRYL